MTIDARGWGLHFLLSLEVTALDNLAGQNCVTNRTIFLDLPLAGVGRLVEFL